MDGENNVNIRAKLSNKVPYQVIGTGSNCMRQRNGAGFEDRTLAVIV